MRGFHVIAVCALVPALVSCQSALQVTEPTKTFPVLDGGRDAVIVAPVVHPRSDHFLVRYIEESTGRKIKAVRERDHDPATMPYPIFAGRTKKAQELFGDKLKDMDADSYIVHVTENMAVLTGPSDRSARWAQVDFLRKYMGIDSYIPTPLGMVVPKHQRVLAPVETRFEVPAFRSRAFSRLNSKGRTIGWRMYRRYAFHHNLHSFITPKEFGRTHPEYFPERDGKRIIVSSSASPGPCIANPGVVRVVIEKCRKYFDKNPGKLTISLGMTDGGWCECAKCKLADGPSIEINGKRTPKSFRYYTFVNQVAKALQESHPGKSIGVLGYAGADYPPEGIEVQRNIIPYMCYTRANWYDRDVKKADLKVIDAWADRVDQIGLYEYLYGTGFSIPRIYNHYLAECLRHVAKKGGGGFYAEIYSNHGLDGPKAWVTEKLLWDPFQDVDDLVHKWCTALFEDAAPAMEKYFNRLERTRIRNGRRLPGKPFGKFYYFNRDRQLDLFRPKDMDKLWADLDRARRAANSDLVRQRIDYFASTLKITDLTVRQYHAYKRPKQLYIDKAPSAELLAALLEGDRAAPEEDVKAYTAKIQAEDPTKFLGGVEISLSTEIARSIVVNLAWSEVYRLLKSGERDREKLVAAAKARIAAAAPPDAGAHPATKARMTKLLQQCERIAVARRVDKPPVIDGKPTEDCWQWVDQPPWFAWKSGTAARAATRFALAYDDKYLYVALRCPQSDLAKMARCKGYMASAWKYASVEMHINPDTRDADPEKLRFFQTIPAYGGGLWERGQRATERYAVTDNGKDLFEIEFALSFEKMKMSPKQFPFMRMNFVRNIRGGGHSGLAWFPSTGAHASYDARGWVIFE